MTKIDKCRAALAVLLFASSPAYASTCKDAIASVQAQVDAAIEKNASSANWKPESLDALRGYQPTPQSLAHAEGRSGRNLQLALDALAHARAAARAGDTALCRRQVSEAKLILQRRP